MSTIAHSRASLGFSGDDLDPDDLSARLGASPHLWARKGDCIRSVRRRPEVVAETGRWGVGVEPRQPGDLDGQVQELLGMLTPDLAVWRDLTARYQCRLFVGLFMKVFNEGLELSVESLGMLGARGVRLDLDIYGSDKGPHGVRAGMAPRAASRRGRAGTLRVVTGGRSDAPDEG